MLRALSTLRPIARTSTRSLAAKRTFISTSRVLASKDVAHHDEHHAPAPPQLYGPDNTPPDAIPTDEQQATGIERFQLLGRMEGVDVFDMHPLDSSRLGTMKDPIKVATMFPERLIGCTGSPADSHEVVWLDANITRDRHRCPECGSGTLLFSYYSPSIFLFFYQIADFSSASLHPGLPRRRSCSARSLSSCAKFA
ncbi:COX5B-domain-containing protein [Fomitiporia mediterranea MF3/22]|uniref:COX5B-domain-containing protein n=1 Tax=Fomitiporia mediterranea (strain MF3/22) TaxID=694068 RepID=UPI0004409C55|nr:COX5B-domain-containing protein [Fomitiporia mediterranea MF3/22]EJD06905.1 COX5B-domain-containing protein [Fomitiporia mediterranea MF3/22]